MTEVRGEEQVQGGLDQNVQRPRGERAGEQKTSEQLEEARAWSSGRESRAWVEMTPREPFWRLPPQGRRTPLMRF